MNDLLPQNNILNLTDGLECYGYSDRMFTRKFLRQLLTVLLSNLSALALVTADGLVVSRFVGNDALNSVELLSPFVMVVSSFSGILSSGTNYVLSKTFGLGSEEALRKFFRALVLLTVAFLIGIAILQIPILYIIIGIYDIAPEIKEMMYLYAFGIAVSNCASIVNVVCTYILIASGRTKALLKLAILESALNVALDLLFVPLCKLGVLGAGLGSAASCAARSVASVALVQKLFRVFPTKRVDCGCEVREILSTGVPKTLSSLVSSVMGFVMSAVIANYGGQEAVTVVSTTALAGSFMSLVANSFVQAGTSMTGLLVASEEWEIVKNIQKKIMAMCVLAVSGIVLILFLFPQITFAIYKLPDYTDFQKFSLRLYVLKYVAFSCELCLVNLCVFCGKKNVMMAMSIPKILLPPTFMLLWHLNKELVFLCYFICEAIPTGILSFVLIRTLRRKAEESKKFRCIHFSFRGREAVAFSEKLGRFLREQGVPPKLANRLALVCEEIGSYAESGVIGDDPQIFLSVRKSDDAIRVVYLDDGKPAILNKKLMETVPVLNNYALIERMAEEFTYQNVGSMNSFIIRFGL